MYNEEQHQNFMTQMDQQTPGKYDCAGIYCIKIEDKLVYIGKSANIKERIASHLCNILKYSNEYKAHKYEVLRQAIKSHFTIGFDVMYRSIETDPELIKEDIGEKEGELIRQYRPPLNSQIPKAEDWHKFFIDKTAQTIGLDEIMGDF